MYTGGMNSSEEFFCVKEIHTMQNCVSFVHMDLLWYNSVNNTITLLSTMYTGGMNSSEEFFCVKEIHKKKTVFRSYILTCYEAITQSSTMTSLILKSKVQKTFAMIQS